MRPNQRMKKWVYSYSLSNSSRSRRVRWSTSRPPPSNTSSDLKSRLIFFPVAQAAAVSDTAHLDTLARLFVRGSVWCCSSLNWSAFYLKRRQRCVVATPAFARRPLEIWPKFEANRDPSPSPKFSNSCRCAPAWVSPCPSSTRLTIFRLGWRRCR